MTVSTVAVLGAGSWGTALGMQLARTGHNVRLWARDEAQAAAMQDSRINQRYLPDCRLPDSLRVNADLDETCAGADYILVAVPSHAFGATVERIAQYVNMETGLAWASKGFEPGTGRLLHEVARERVGDQIPLAVITGPSFAHEVARGLPTAVTAGATTPEFGQLWAGLLHGSGFRAYYTADLVGAELGGAVKNVIAVACGMADGLELGDNARAALITRGLAEMRRLGRALGAEEATLMGLAGAGDLVLTCTGNLSRNRRLGLALGAGRSVDEAVAEIGQVVEGIKTAEEVMRLARRAKVEMPIAEQVHGILYRGWSARKGVRVLMERHLKPEAD